MNIPIICRRLLSGLACLGFISGCSDSIKQIEIKEKVVALTFDDGPNPPFTRLLLKTLDEEGVAATFFLVGGQVEKHPEIVHDIIEAGHEVGGHSYGWDSLAFKGQSFFDGQLDKTDVVFAGVGITNLTLFRPPGGILSLGQENILKERGLMHISADVVVGDWKRVNAGTIRDRVLKKVRPGSIIVLHDGGGDRAETIMAVPLIISGLTAKGYRFLTVTELLALRKQ